MELYSTVVLYSDTGTGYSDMPDEHSGGDGHTWAPDARTERGRSA